MWQASAEKGSLVDLLEKGITAAVASAPVLQFPAPSTPLPHATPFTAMDPLSRRTFVLSREDFRGSSGGRGGAHLRSMPANDAASPRDSEADIRATTAHHYDFLTLDEAGMCTVNATGGGALTRLVPTGVLVAEDYTNNKPMMLFSEKIPGTTDMLAVLTLDHTP